MIATSLCIYRVFVLRARSVREAHNTAFWRRKTASSADWFLLSKRVLFPCTRHALPSLCHPTQDSSGSWLHPALLLPTIRFSPSRHHDSPKMHLTLPHQQSVRSNLAWGMLSSKFTNQVSETSSLISLLLVDPHTGSDVCISSPEWSLVNSLLS